MNKMPSGHKHRMSLARKNPDQPALKPCDLAFLLQVSPSTITRSKIPCHKVGSTGTTRRYTLNDYQKGTSHDHTARA
jgi:hypothetical protein